MAEWLWRLAANPRELGSIPRVDTVLKKTISETFQRTVRRKVVMNLRAQNDHQVLN